MTTARMFQLLGDAASAMAEAHMIARVLRSDLEPLIANSRTCLGCALWLEDPRGAKGATKIVRVPHLTVLEEPARANNVKP